MAVDSIAHMNVAQIPAAIGFISGKEAIFQGILPAASQVFNSKLPEPGILDEFLFFLIRPAASQFLDGIRIPNIYCIKASSSGLPLKMRSRNGKNMLISALSAPIS